MLTSRFRLKLRTSSSALGAAPAAASSDVAHGRQIRPTEPSALVEKVVLGVAYHTLEVAGYKASEPSEEETQLTILSHLAMPTSPPKTALASLTQRTGRDYARQGVRAKAVCSNECDTPMLRTGFAVCGLDPNRAMADLDDSMPLGRIARPEEIAVVVLFWTSDAAHCRCDALVEINDGKAVA
ncbi:SDR family oxidoreductase [Mesorhizobium sp. M1380]|uniref:SDR family oxidoreductase n=1 Tax=Mesorhizobium sp. M1380 TaxID=2957093 RepID=UPI0033382CA4